MKNTKYKDSGIPWIGMIPEDWEVCRLKNLHTDSNVGESIDKTFCSDNPNDILFYTAGLKPIHTTYLDFPKWKYTHKSNLLLSRNGTPYVYIPKENAVYSDHIIRIDIDNRFSKEFVRYCLQQAIASVVVDSVSIATWSISLWDKQNIPIPPLPTQQRIADFLDRKCAEIDELAALQETMIAELKRYKQSVITEAVTKGLDPNVPMKDSGVEWIGEIPEGWEVKRLKNLGYLYGGLTGKSGDDFNVDDESNCPYMLFIPFTNIFNNSVIDTGQLFKVRIEEGEVQNLVLKNDLLFLMSSEDYDGVGKPAIIEEQIDNLSLNSFCKGFRISNPTVCAKYLFYHISSHLIREFIRQEAKGFIRINLRQDKLACIPVFLPPLSTQQAIADYLDKKCAEIDELIAIKQQKIEQLKEYKKSVIFEYVTGKKEI